MIIRKGRILTMNEDGDVLTGDLRVSDGRIIEIAPHVNRAEGEDELDATGCLVLPGFVQAHVHLCQTLFRNLADDLQLLDWLQGRIWPYEAWLDAGAMSASADLGLYELIAGGTTSILDMGSVNHADALFQQAEESGLRYVGGKCLMDLDESGTLPDALHEDAAAGLEETARLIDRWHGAAGDRLRYAVAPRFAVSCSEPLLREAGLLACRKSVRIHTHASENRDEVALIKKRTGRNNVDYLVDMGLLGSHAALAHCIWLTPHEVNLLWGSGTHVVHCPSSNLKLASGIARIPELLENGINVALGADGAACNNRLSMFREMHLAALIHRPEHGPRSMPARRVLEMATRGGAKALGLEDEIGSLEPGKKADVIVLDLRAPETASIGDLAAAVVYSADPSTVRHVIVDGRVLKRDFEMLSMDGAAVLRRAEGAWRRLEERFRIA